MRVRKIIRLILFIAVGFTCSMLSADDDKKASLVIIASCTTSIQDQEENVKRNIYFAARSLNNYIIAPNASLSFNAIVGEASEKNGYYNGRVMYRDEIRYESGGGVCQVSSTLFNALLLAGCNIVERHRHFRPVTYVPPGLDATIRYGKKDLKIKNPGQQNLVIKTEVTDKSLIISIQAESSTGITYELVTEEEDVEIPLSQEASSIRNGLNVSVFRKKLQSNTVIQSQLLYRDYYPPVYTK